MENELEDIRYRLCCYRNAYEQWGQDLDGSAFRPLVERLRTRARDLNRECIRRQSEGALRQVSFLVEVQADWALRAIPRMTECGTDEHGLDRVCYILEAAAVALRVARIEDNLQ